MPVKPQALCLSDASVLLKVILRYGQSSADVVEMKMESLVRVWANLVAASNGWDAHGDEPVFDCIDELIALQVFVHLTHLVKMSGLCLDKHKVWQWVVFNSGNLTYFSDFGPDFYSSFSLTISLFNAGKMFNNSVLFIRSYALICTGDL